MEGRRKGRREGEKGRENERKGRERERVEKSVGSMRKIHGEREGEREREMSGEVLYIWNLLIVN